MDFKLLLEKACSDCVMNTHREPDYILCNDRDFIEWSMSKQPSLFGISLLSSNGQMKFYGAEVIQSNHIPSGTAVGVIKTMKV